MTETILKPPSFNEVLIEAKTTQPEQESFSIGDLIQTLGSTIKHDNANKVITFLGMILTYTEEDQINIGFLAESSTGKSYIPLELSHYFPEADIKQIGYASPTAFFHDHLSQTKPIKDEENTYIVNLHQKILIFIDQPHDMLLQRLRPILSHDKKVIELMITDRNKNKNLRTSHVNVIGYPTVIFSTAKFGMSDQEKTRLLLLSPETTQKKLEDSINLKIKKESNRQVFKETLMKDSRITALKQKVLEIKQAKIKYIIVPDELVEIISKRFFEKHKKLLPRNQRDISRLISLIKAHALLAFKNRERKDDKILVTQEDIDVGFELYETVSEANELGVSPELYGIYGKLVQFIEQYFERNSKGIAITDYQYFYEQTFYRTPSYEVVRDTLKSLVSLNLLLEEQDTIDRRVRRYLLPECVPKTEESTQW